jgi:LytS/YehU family sensor histidine kinase
VRNITTQHGLPSTEIYSIGFDDSNIWLGTPNGVVKYEFDEINLESISPHVENILVNGNNIDFSKNMVLNYKENDITINFKTINLETSTNTLYKYRLNDDTNWYKIKSPSIVFNSLKPSSYKVEISSANEDQIWSKPLVINFTINKPWFNHWLFYISILVILSGIYYLIYSNRMKTIKNEANFKQEINRLEKMALQGQMNPHFLSNAFTAIQNLITSNQNEKADKYLTKLSRLLRKILESSRSYEISLKDEIELLHLYTTLEEIRFDNKFITTFYIDESIDLKKTYIMPMLLQPIVENAINHGLRQIRKIGSLNIEFIKNGNNDLLCKISDNGIGRKASNLSKTKAESESLSSKIIQERIQKHNLSNENKVSMEYFDSDQGTTVIFIIGQK